MNCIDYQLVSVDEAGVVSAGENGEAGVVSPGNMLRRGVAGGDMVRRGVAGAADGLPRKIMCKNYAKYLVVRKRMFTFA